MENQQLLDQSPLIYSINETDLRTLFIYFEQGLGDRVILNKLVKRGIEEAHGTQMILESRNLYQEVLKKKAQKDIIVGGLWFVAGTVCTLANIGFIFWGAILFGLIQCIKGIVNYNKY